MTEQEYIKYLYSRQRHKVYRRLVAVGLVTVALLIFAVYLASCNTPPAPSITPISTVDLPQPEPSPVNNYLVGTWHHMVNSEPVEVWRFNSDGSFWAVDDRQSLQGSWRVINQDPIMIDIFVDTNSRTYLVEFVTQDSLYLTGQDGVISYWKRHEETRGDV